MKGTNLYKNNYPVLLAVVNVKVVLILSQHVHLLYMKMVYNFKKQRNKCVNQVFKKLQIEVSRSDFVMIWTDRFNRIWWDFVKKYLFVIAVKFISNTMFRSSTFTFYSIQDRKRNLNEFLQYSWKSATRNHHLKSRFCKLSSHTAQCRSTSQLYSGVRHFL